MLKPQLPQQKTASSPVVGRADFSDAEGPLKGHTFSIRQTRTVGDSSRDRASVCL